MIRDTHIEEGILSCIIKYNEVCCDVFHDKIYHKNIVNWKWILYQRKVELKDRLDD